MISQGHCDISRHRTATDRPSADPRRFRPRRPETAHPIRDPVPRLRRPGRRTRRRRRSPAPCTTSLSPSEHPPYPPSPVTPRSRPGPAHRDPAISFRIGSGNPHGMCLICGYPIPTTELADHPNTTDLQAEKARHTRSHSDCHAEGRGFEPLQPLSEKPSKAGGFLMGKGGRDRAEAVFVTEICHRIGGMVRIFDHEAPVRFRSRCSVVVARERWSRYPRVAGLSE